MKKTLKAFALASTFVVSGASVVSCGSQRPPVIEQDDKYIDENLLEEIINKANEDFNVYLIEEYGTSENPKIDYFNFVSWEKSIIYDLEKKYSELLKKYENEIKNRENIKFDSLKIYKHNEELKADFLDLNGVKLNNKTAIVKNDEIKNIGNADFKQLNFSIYSKEVYKRSLLNVDLPILNFYYEKKDIKDLIKNHNEINNEVFTSHDDINDIFKLKAFNRNLVTEEVSEDYESVLEIINKIGDFYGENYWDMIEQKQNSYLYTEMTNSFKNSTISVNTKRYDLRKWNKKRPSEKNYCSIVDESQEKDLNHYCSQLEDIKDQVANLQDEETLDIIVNINFTKNSQGILKEGEQKYISLYFGSIKPYNDKSFYEYDF